MAFNANSIIRYFDILSEVREKNAKAFSSDGERELHWLPQWIALYLGILTQRFFSVYIKTGSWNLTGFWGWMIAASIIALMAFPAVYKSSIDAKKPLILQLCVIFATGMGWQSLVQVGGGTVLKVATGA